MILQMILLGSLLSQPVNGQATNQQRRFHEAVKYWTETLCTLQKTKTLTFHGFFANGTRILRDLFDVLIRTTNEYCNTVVLLKTHSTLVLDRDRGSITRANRTRNEGRDPVERETLRRLTSTMNFIHRGWRVRRNWRTNDDYYIDMRHLNVIFIGDSEAFAESLDRSSFDWNGGQHFIVLAVWNEQLKRLSDRGELIVRTLRKLWLGHRALGLLFNEPLSGFDFHSYNPFAVNNEGAWGRLERIEAISQRRMLRLLSTLSYRRTIDFNGYRFNVSIFKRNQGEAKNRERTKSIVGYTGSYNRASRILLQVLREKTNFTVNVIDPSSYEMDGYRKENCSFIGAIEDLVQRKVVASFASFFVKEYGKHTSGMEFTATMGFDEVCVIVPKADRMPKSLRVYRIFHWSAWLGMISAYTLMYLIWYCIQILAPRRFRKIDDRTTAFHAYLVNAGRSIPLPNTISETCLLSSLFLGSVTSMGIFNAVLYASFTRNVSFKEIDTLMELDKTGLPIGYFSHSIRDLFGNEDDPHLSPVLRRLQRRMIHVPNGVAMAAFHRNISGLARKQYYRLTREIFVNENGMRMVHQVRECPARFYIACLLPSNSFLRERINVLIGRLNQAGLPNLWRTRLGLDRTLKKKIDVKLSDESRGKTFEPIQLRDLEICILVYATGLLLSVVVFFGEKGWLKFCYRKMF